MDASTNTTSNKEYPLKLTMGEEIRRVRLVGLEGTISYEMFFTTAMTAFPLFHPVSFEWTDDEGDIIKMANDAQFQEALVVQKQRPILRFNVLCETSVMVDEGLVAAPAEASEELPVEAEAAAAAPAIVVEEESVAEVATVPLGEETPATSAEESWVVVAEPEPSVVGDEALVEVTEAPAAVAAPETEAPPMEDHSQALEAVAVEEVVAVSGFDEPLVAVPEEVAVTGEAPLLQAPALVLPPGFTQHIDPVTGMTFYANTATGATQWEFPKAPASFVVEEEPVVSPEHAEKEKATNTHHEGPSLHGLAQAVHHMEEMVVNDAKEVIHHIEEAFHHIRTSHDASTQSDEQPAEPPVVLPSVVEDATITSTGAEQEGDLYDVTFPTQAALGLTLLPTKLPIGEGGKTLDVCVVSRSAFTSLIKEGDILLGCNHKSLCTTSWHCSPEEFLQTVVKEGILPFAPPRTLRLVRGTSQVAVDSVLFHFKHEDIGLFKAY